MKQLFCLFLFVAVCGCESFRHEYSPKTDITPKVRQKYALRTCHVYHYSKVLKEHHRDIMDATAFKDGDLREIEKFYPDVFSSDGIPVSIRLCYDMDRFDTGNSLLGLADAFLFLGTVGIIPLVSPHDEYVDVEIEVGSGNKKSPRVAVEGSTRCIIWTLGLNLLFPFDDPADSRFSASGRACCGSATENHSHAVQKRCRITAYAYAIAVALTEYEKTLSLEKRASEISVAPSTPVKSVEKPSAEKPASAVVEIETIPL